MRSIRTRKNAAYRFVGNALALGAFFCFLNIRLNLLTLFVCGELFNQFAFGRENHKGYAENGVGAGGEDIETQPLPLPLSTREGCRSRSINYS